ncbi:amidohydrolase [Salibacterium salarium]|uniref:Amidohydrolase n=1 Tax=Salibacterium salarium TaxID=284579 RepID=A0A428N7B1_9BACI|nr:amidohydrolase [Salibacterium salarium]RSL34270.1 amidohydrolase [Salibacterium salarium]
MGRLWYNGSIYTMEHEDSITEAVYTESGWIKATGTKEMLEKEYQPAEEINLQGAAMYPGFTDSHLHMLGLGETMLSLDLSDITSATEMKQALQKRTESLKNGEWLIGEGWNENNFSDRKIFHRTELDEIAPNNPILLTRICRHASLVNSATLKKADITKDTTNPEGGIIVRDEDGEATGYLLDQAADLIKKILPPVKDEQLRTALRMAVSSMLEQGLTGGHTEDLNYYGSFQRTFRTFQDVINENGIKFRTNLLVHHGVLNDMKELGYKYGRIDDYLSFGAVKIFADGAIGGRTALLRSPYYDNPETSGVAIHSKDGLKHIVKEARASNMPVAIHVIGDLALEYAIEAIEEYPPPEGEKDRLIHAQITPPDLVERLQNLAVTFDLQPRFVLSDFPWVEERLGEERLHHSFAWKTLLDAGLDCAGSSDAPIEPVSPLQGIHAAISRKLPTDTTHQGYIPAQKLTRFEAVSLYTTGSAAAVGKENELGKIAAGYRADFTILEEDIFHIPLDSIVDVSIAGTVIEGEFQYDTAKEQRRK